MKVFSYLLIILFKSISLLLIEKIKCKLVFTYHYPKRDLYLVSDNFDSKL